ncbi:MarR family winged helix-turn-helix transcriptional regulator [Altericroceibacterium xinjiangense]|uniref:MarR family winged helix-turn-helix transcriptional regulator n=1 Tax=Altericroceibacterium xinjiangense TaxID=762261 RepID=UPI000F7E83B9|nr:MarR family winged helix-turn-helix transcriptional regulator [Altericroceibacterium xinjiangense]
MAAETPSKTIPSEKVSPGKTAGADAGARLDWGVLAHSIGPRVRLLRNALSARSMAALTDFGLPTGSHTVLALMSANPGSSQTQLADKAGLTKSALVGIVDELERRGLAARDRSSRDRRRNRLTLTPEGQDQLARMFAAASAQEGPIQVALGEEDVASLLALLDRAIEAIEQDEA